MVLVMFLTKLMINSLLQPVNTGFNFEWLVIVGYVNSLFISQNEYINCGLRTEAMHSFYSLFCNVFCCLKLSNVLTKMIYTECKLPENNWKHFLQ